MDETLLAKVVGQHRPSPPATEAALAIATSLNLPPDLLTFYRACDGAALQRVGPHEGTLIDTDCAWVWPVREIRELRTVVEENSTIKEALSEPGQFEDTGERPLGITKKKRFVWLPGPNTKVFPLSTRRPAPTSRTK